MGFGVAKLASIAPLVTPDQIFYEPFDDNKLGWYVGETAKTDFILRWEMKDRKYYRYMEMSDKYNDKLWGYMPIPNVSESNFCLIFDAKKASGTAKGVGIVITARETRNNEDYESYYLIRLYEEGKGLIHLRPKSGGLKQIGIFNSVAWSDKLPHKIAISFQDNILEIIDWQIKTSLYKRTIESDDLLSDRGNIGIGAEMLPPGGNITIEFDNVSIYDKCPQ